MHIEQIYVLVDLDGDFIETIAEGPARSYTDDVRHATLMDFATANANRRHGETITRLDLLFKHSPRVAYSTCCREHSNR